MASSVILSLHCSSAPDRSFFVKRKVHLPSVKGAPAVRFVKELRHLLQSRGDRERNHTAMRMALAGDWKRAHGIWKGLAKGDDCRILNNLGVAWDMRGMNAAAIASLARAYELCGGDERIRWNYRSVLGNRVPPTPRYRIRDEPAGNRRRPGTDIVPRVSTSNSEAGRKAMEKRRAEAKRRAQAKQREQARRRAEAKSLIDERRKARAQAKRLEEERRRKAKAAKAAEERRKAEARRKEAERKRKEAERKREPNTYFEP